MKKRLRPGDITAAALVLILICLAVWFRRYRCPLDMTLGIPCPFCGMTRALRSLMAGDVEAAFYYHPLWPLAVLGIILWFFVGLGALNPPKKAVDIALCCIGAAFLICFTVRHVTGSPVVQTHFETSLIYRFLQLLM